MKNFATSVRGSNRIVVRQGGIVPTVLMCVFAVVACAGLVLGVVSVARTSAPRGESAFQIAVRNGFTGTEQQWLESLMGQTGQAGRDSDAVLRALQQLFEEEVAADRWCPEDDGDFIVFLIENGFTGPAGPQGTSMDMRYAANVSLRSAVGVLAFNFPGSPAGQGGTGSGVIYMINHISETIVEAYILTNFHVISRFSVGTGQVYARDVSVILYAMPRSPMSATIIGGSPEHDLAMLRVRGDYAQLRLPVAPVRHNQGNFLDNPTVLDFARSRIPAQANWEVTVGTPVIAVGMPGVNASTVSDPIVVTDGIISGRSEEISLGNLVATGNIQYRVWRTTAAINPGNSGGGVFNARGELVGIVMARMFTTTVGRDEVPIDNTAFIVPIAPVINFAEQIIHRVRAYPNQTPGTPLRAIQPRMGITVRISDESFGIRECPEVGYVVYRNAVLVVDAIDPNASVYGDLRVGDVILSLSYMVEGRNVEVKLYQFHQMRDAMLDFYRTHDSVITFTVVRYGNAVPISIPMVFTMPSTV